MTTVATSSKAPIFSVGDEVRVGMWIGHVQEVDWSSTGWEYVVRWGNQPDQSNSYSRYAEGLLSLLSLVDEKNPSIWDMILEGVGDE